MSIKTRIFLGMSIIFLICVVLAVSILVITKKQRHDGIIINLAGRQRMLTQKMSKEILGLLYGLRVKGKKNTAIEADLKKSLTIFDTTLKCLIGSGKALTTLNVKGPTHWIPPARGEALKQLKKVNSLWIPFKKNIEMAMESSDMKMVDKAIDYVLTHNIELLKEMNKAVGLLQKQADKNVTLLRITSILGVVLGIIVLLAMLWWVRRSIVEPIENLVHFAREVSEEYSKQDEEIELDRSNDEVAVLRSVLEKMVENLKLSIEEARELTKKSEEMAAKAEEARIRAEEARKVAEENERALREIAQEIDEASKKLVSFTEELSAQADEVLSGADTQKQRTEETATAMEEMNATVLEVAKNASLAAENAEKAREHAEIGGKVVDEAVDAINEINEMTEGLKANMEKLKGKADSISQVITVITDIADQTNLLALNAAIEAARAGDAGKGFAVVADEVRKLAEKTMNATKEVEYAVKEIQQEVNRNVSEMNNVAESVSKGTKLSRESRAALEEIVNLVVSIAEQIRSIATASEEQSAASEEITRSITEIREISDSTVQSTEQTRMSIQDLVNMSAELKDLVDKLVNR